MPSIVPSVSIELGGKVRHLRFDFNAIYWIKENAKIDFLLGMKNLSNPEMFHVLPIVIQGCLLTETPKLPIEEVRSWLYPGNIEEVSMKLKELVDVSTPNRSEGEASKDAAPLAGERSGPPADSISS